MHESGGKSTVAFRQISPYVSKIQPFRILIGMFQNWGKVACLEISNVVNSNVAKFGK